MSEISEKKRNQIEKKGGEIIRREKGYDFEQA